MKSFGKNLRKHSTKITNCEKKQMIPLTIEEIYHVMSKKSVIYAKTNLALMIKNTIN